MSATPNRSAPQTRGGLEAMTTPRGARAEMEELHAATAVCDALSVYYSADTFREMDNDGLLGGPLPLPMAPGGRRDHDVYFA